MGNKRYCLRGVVGKDLNERAIRKFAKQVVSYIYANKLQPSIIIGKDNRVSSDYVLGVVESVLLAKGVTVYAIDISTTPELVYLTKKFKFSLGIMITASHNSYEYNGLKCFSSFGEIVEIHNLEIKNYKTKDYGKIVNIGKYKELYLRELKNQLNPNDIRCVFDCANGASVDVVRKIFTKQQIIGNETSGKYINNECGSENLDTIKAVCRRSKKIGFAFDGDADRVVAIDCNGNIVDGDKILYILATQQLGFGDKVIGTQISGLGLEISLRSLGVGLIREKVGTKYVSDRMRKENIKLGGESCGHIFLDKSSTSDGVRVAIELLNILNRTGQTFEQLLSGYKELHSLSKSLNIEESKAGIEFEQTCKDMRVVVRKSETEPKVRVFVEGVDRELVRCKFERLVQELSK